MKTGGKVLLGLGAAGVGAALYFLFKKRALVGSSPSEWALPSFNVDASEWALPSFTNTNEFLAPPMVAAPQCRCPSGTTPSIRADGSCSCPEVTVEILPFELERS